MKPVGPPRWSAAHGLMKALLLERDRWQTRVTVGFADEKLLAARIPHAGSVGILPAITTGAAARPILVGRSRRA